MILAIIKTDLEDYKMHLCRLKLPLQMPGTIYLDSKSLKLNNIREKRRIVRSFYEKLKPVLETSFFT